MLRFSKLASCRSVRSGRCLFSTVQEPQQQERKRLDVAIVGLPNAGKSQLLNVLTQSSVAAVSRKRHTTRSGILGARTIDRTQLMFVDTPGFLRRSQARQEGLDRDLVLSAATEMTNVDYSLLVVDAARRLTEDTKATLTSLMIQACYSMGRMEVGDSAYPVEPLKECFGVVLNKVDLVHPKAQLLDMAEELSILAETTIRHAHKEQEIEVDDTELLNEYMPMFFYVSARREEGVDDVLEHLLSKATPCHVWDVDERESSTLSPEERTEEVIREKLYRCLHREVPYHVRQNNRLFRTGRDKQGKLGLMIDQELIVKTKSHQRLVLGTGGRTLERIRETAERDLRKLFGCTVVLQLHVKHLKSKNQSWGV